MKVRDLMNRLRATGADAVVLWLAPYSDTSEAEEACVVTLAKEPWTCERKMSAGGGLSDVHYPSSHGPSIGWDEATDQCWLEHVVILSAASGVQYG
jgi:hypothetical protein